MALEDAVVLCEELASTPDIEAGLAAFERRRRPRIEALRQLMANRVARATGRTETQTSEPFSLDPWTDQASLLSTPPPEPCSSGGRGTHSAKVLLSPEGKAS